MNEDAEPRPSRRRFLSGLASTGVALAGLPLLSGCGLLPSQPTPQPKVPRIGYLGTGRPGVNQQAFQQGLRELGYIEGQNIAVEYRFAEQLEQLPGFADELVRLKVDVIVAAGTPASGAAKNATATIPIVIVDTGLGLVDSLARPGGNVTGLANFEVQLSGKRLELLKEALPSVARVALLWDAEQQGMRRSHDASVAAVAVLGLQYQSLAVRHPDDLEAAFDAAIQERADALITFGDPFTNRNRQQIADLANHRRLATMFTAREFTQAGGLMSYGASVPDLYRRSATYVDKILKGANPAELPVELPTTFELVVNRKTAQALGLTIAQSVLLQATEVIQ